MLGNAQHVTAVAQGEEREEAIDAERHRAERHDRAIGQAQMNAALGPTAPARSATESRESSALRPRPHD